MSSKENDSLSALNDLLPESSEPKTESSPSQPEASPKGDDYDVMADLNLDTQPEASVEPSLVDSPLEEKKKAKDPITQAFEKLPPKQQKIALAVGAVVALGIAGKMFMGGSNDAPQLQAKTAPVQPAITQQAAPTISTTLPPATLPPVASNDSGWNEMADANILPSLSDSDADYASRLVDEALPEISIEAPKIEVTSVKEVVEKKTSEELLAEQQRAAALESQLAALKAQLSQKDEQLGTVTQKLRHKLADQTVIEVEAEEARKQAAAWRQKAMIANARPNLTIKHIARTQGCTECRNIANGTYNGSSIMLIDGDQWNGYNVGFSGDSVVLSRNDLKYTYYAQ